MPAHRIQCCPDFYCLTRGVQFPRGFRNFRNFRTPIANRATPILVSRTARATTDFLGTGDGGMAVGGRRASVTGGAQPAEFMGGIAVAQRSGWSRGACHAPFRAVRTKRNQPGIMRVTFRSWPGSIAPSHDPALAPLPVAVAQQALVELAGRMARQLGLEVDAARASMTTNASAFAPQGAVRPSATIGRMVGRPHKPGSAQASHRAAKVGANAA